LLYIACLSWQFSPLITRILQTDYTIRFF